MLPLPELFYCTLLVVMSGTITAIALVSKKIFHIFHFTKDIAPALKREFSKVTKDC